MKSKHTFGYFNLVPVISSSLIFVFSVLFLICFYSGVVSIEKDYTELKYLQENRLPFDQLKSYFKDLSQKKGAVYAYEILKKATLPPDTDLHLLGHVVGEILYQQHGAEGMKYCTQDFRNACSHTVAVGIFLEKGEAALDEIARVCAKAPGGKGASSMCYHGLGHGVLAFTNYDFPHAIELCNKTGTTVKNYQESAECIGGMIMEQISGGDHDKSTWELKRQVNLKLEDPLYPCNSTLITGRKAKAYCYLYLTPHLFNSSGLMLSGRPADETIIRAFKLCERIPLSEGASRESCFGGFGKEFVVLAKDRDIRKIDQMSDEENLKIYYWCNLTNNEKGKQACIKYALNSIYWGGENDRSGAIKFCNLAPDEKLKNFCFSELISSVSVYIDSLTYRKDFCQEIPPKLADKCKEKLLK